VFIGALVFWTVALGLGGWSLMIVSDGGLEPATVAVPPTATAVEPKPGREGSEAEAPAPGERIPVQMQESQVPEDLDGSDVAALPGGALLGP
jgi:hypothetical protein